MSLNRPEYFIILVGCLMSMVAGILQIIAAILLPQMINALNSCIYSSRQHRITALSFSFLLMAIVVLVVRIVQFSAFTLSGARLTQRVRSKVFSSLLRQEVGYFDLSENNSGALGARLSSDALSIQKMTGNRLGVIFEILAMVIVGLGIGFSYSYQLTLIMLFSLTTLLVVIYAQIRFMSEITRRSDAKLEQASSLAIEVLHNVRTVKQLTAEKQFLQQYYDLVYQSFAVRRNASMISAFMFAFFWSTYAFIIAALYWCALIMMEQQESKTNSAVVVFAFAAFLLPFLQTIVTIMDDTGASLKAAQNFFDLFDRIPTIDNGLDEGQELINFRGDIEFDQVKFAYPSRPMSHAIFENFRLSIMSGESVAIVGASGSGKSTIVQLLERFYDVTDGQIRLDNVDIRKLNIRWLRSRLGLVSQEPVLFNLTVAENIAYGIENPNFEDIKQAAIRANIHEFIKQMPQGYESRVGHKGIHLSGGQKQRIAIARILFRQPKVLILDEATSALDSRNEQIVQEALERVRAEDPTRTVLTIAHRQSTIRSSDRIYVIDN